MNKDLLKLLDNIKQEEIHDEEGTFHKNSRVLIIDGLNLFFRNFAVLNYMNPQGVHIGGLGGFLRSLGSLINLTKPTSVYIVFDGVGSSLHRKNLIPEYKSGRGMQKITNGNMFDTLDEENESKVDQIGRLIHYLRCLPVKIIALDRVEADDVMAYLSKHLTESFSDSKAYIVSSDKDFLQLVTDRILVYRPTEKQFYSPKEVKEKFGVLPSNFILYKTLIGDSSDKIQGVKDLGKVTTLQKFPELATTPLTLEDLFDISNMRREKHVVYSRILLESQRIKDTYKIMDLGNPLLDDEEKKYLDEVINNDVTPLNVKDFLKLYHEDGIVNIIKNGDFWIRDTFNTINGYSK
jgi:5'-3' exonuclease